MDGSSFAGTTKPCPPRRDHASGVADLARDHALCRAHQIRIAIPSALGKDAGEGQQSSVAKWHGMRRRLLHGGHRHDRANLRRGRDVSCRIEQGVRAVRLQCNSMRYAMQRKQRLRPMLLHVCCLVLQGRYVRAQIRRIMHIGHTMCGRPLLQPCVPNAKVDTPLRVRYSYMHY